VPPMSNSTEALKIQITRTIKQADEDMLSRVWTELDQRWDTKSTHKAFVKSFEHVDVLRRL
jgi:hypothetical protein